MLSLKSFATASAVITLISGASAGPLQQLHTRNSPPTLPSCSSYTPFKYAGCFTEQSTPTTSLIYRTNLDSQNMTVEICTAFCKGNDYQYAGLEYYGECFCGASVNGMQVDESFCTYPCTGDKTETCGATDYISVYQDPTYPVEDYSTIADYNPLGCYTDLTTQGRTLEWQQTQVDASSLTVETCLFACKDGGYPLAGVEYGQECWCGVVLGNGTSQVDSSQCNMPCNGNSTETCGAGALLNIYVATDIESTEPCNGGGGGSSSSSSSSSSTATSSSSTTSSTSSTVTLTSSSSSSSSSTIATITSSSATTVCTTSTTAKTSSSTKATTTSTTISTTTSTKPSLCTATTTVTPTPTCEYQCGDWCSTPIPDFSDAKGCTTAASACAVQVASCFLHAGFPASLKCFEFATWCANIGSFGKSYCPGGSCSKASCKSKYPPTGPTPTPTLSTSVYTCKAASTSSSKTTSSATTTSCVPVPTTSNICVQPNSPSKGYSSTSPVGSIPLPVLTCNNLYTDYFSNPFKLYTSSDSSKCSSYRGDSGSISQGCKDACDSQYSSCISTYAQSCKSNTAGSGKDTYSQATTKCQNQQSDCYNANSGVSASSGRCGSWNNGWK